MTVFPAFATSSWKVKMPSILTRFAKSYALPADFTACYLKTGSVFRMFSLQSVRHWAESPSFIKIFLILSSKAPARCLFLVLQLALSVSNFQQGDLHLRAAVDLNGRKSVIVFSEALMMCAAGSREFTVCSYTPGALWSGGISIKPHVLFLPCVSLKRLLLQQLQGSEQKLLRA